MMDQTAGQFTRQPLTSDQYLELMKSRRQNPSVPTSQDQLRIPVYQPPTIPVAHPQPVTTQPAQPSAPQPIVKSFSATKIDPLPVSGTNSQSSVSSATDSNSQSRSNRPSTAFEESQLFPGQFKPIPEETILEWTAPSRPFKKRNRQFYTTVGAITFLISLILFFAGQFLPIAVVFSVAFLAYVLSSVPPESIVNKITTHGLRSDNQIFYWAELGRFWFDEKYQQPLLHVEVARFPGRLTMMLNNVTRDQLSDVLSEVLLKEKPKDTFIDKTAKWLQEKIPLDNT